MLQVLTKRLLHPAAAQCTVHTQGPFPSIPEMTAPGVPVGVTPYMPRSW